MDIDRKLLSRAAALLSEARDAVERVRTKAGDYQTVTEDQISELTTLIETIEGAFAAADKLTKED